jgi:hypothetical protein
MKWFICFYILPAIISAWLLPQFLEYQHMNGDEDIANLYIDEIQYKSLFKYATLTPIINLVTAILLVIWSVLPR